MRKHIEFTDSLFPKENQSGYIHVFEYISGRLDILKDTIKPLNAKVAYQRPCSNRLIPETQHWVDDIFSKIGAERIERKYDRENALCCGQVLRAHQREEMADEIQNRNLEDMKATGAETYSPTSSETDRNRRPEAARPRHWIPVLKF